MATNSLYLRQISTVRIEHLREHIVLSCVSLVEHFCDGHGSFVQLCTNVRNDFGHPNWRVIGGSKRVGITLRGGDILHIGFESSQKLPVRKSSILGVDDVRHQYFPVQAEVQDFFHYINLDIN